MQQAFDDRFFFLFVCFSAIARVSGRALLSLQCWCQSIPYPPPPSLHVLFFSAWPDTHQTGLCPLLRVPSSSLAGLPRPGMDIGFLLRTANPSATAIEDGQQPAASTNLRSGVANFAVIPAGQDVVVLAGLTDSIIWMRKKGEGDQSGRVGGKKKGRDDDESRSCPRWAEGERAPQRRLLAATSVACILVLCDACRPKKSEQRRHATAVGCWPAGWLAD